MKKLITYTVTLCQLAALSLLMLGCHRDEIAEAPAYLRIEPFTVSTDVALHGSNTHKITDGWVYVGSDLIGGFTLPITLPILATDTQTIYVFAGIKDNGIAATPELYPFYSAYETRTYLPPGETVTIRPTTFYKPSTNFRLLEDFEGNPVLNLDLDNDAATRVETVRNTPDTLQGAAGKLMLTKEHPILTVATADAYALPYAGLPVYLELDYKNDVSFDILLQGTAPGAIPVTERVMTVFARTTWNKLYVNLTDILSESQLPQYRIVIDAYIDSTTTTQGTIFIDNLKLLHQ